jgi:hypothetical protein
VGLNFELFITYSSIDTLLLVLISFSFRIFTISYAF